MWVPKDVGYYRRQKVVAAGVACERAPAVLDWLTCEAKSQADGDRDEHGWVKSGYAAIAHGACFGHATADDARTAVSQLVHAGLLDDFEEHAAGIFTARISGWREDVFLKLEATRARTRRASKAETPAPEPKDSAGRSGTGDDTSQNVPQSPLQDRTGQNRDDDGRAGARTDSNIGHPQLDEVLAQLRTVDGLAVDDMGVLNALTRAERSGLDGLELAEATVAAAREYIAAGTMRARGASTLMNAILKRREESAAAQLARKGAELRAEIEGRRAPSRRGRQSEAEQYAAELEKRASELEAAEALRS